MEWSRGESLAKCSPDKWGTVVHSDRRATMNPTLYFQGYATPGWRGGVLSMYDTVRKVYCSASLDAFWHGYNSETFAFQSPEYWIDGEPTYMPVDTPL